MYRVISTSVLMVQLLSESVILCTLSLRAWPRQISKQNLPIKPSQAGPP